MWRKDEKMTIKHANARRQNFFHVMVEMVLKRSAILVKTGKKFIDIFPVFVMFNSMSEGYFEMIIRK